MSRRDEGYSLIHMSAKQLREAGKLWPQTLTDEELAAEFVRCDANAEPISHRMLFEESQARALRPHDHASDEDCAQCRAEGHVPPTEEKQPQPPYPWCRGNPTREACIKAGYCRRDPNCGD